MTTILVTNNGDSGPNTLRDAINTANTNAGDYTINIGPSITLILLTSGTLNITKSNGNLNIISLAPSRTEIARLAFSATPFFRIFTLNYPHNSGFNIYFKNLKITNGRFSNGSGIFANNCNLEIDNCEISENEANYTYNTSATTDISCGAGIFVDSCNLIIGESEITDNSCTMATSLPNLVTTDMLCGGGLYMRNSISNIGNSIFSNNSIKLLDHLLLDSVRNLCGGGGIYVFENKESLIDNSIISNNIISSSYEINITNVDSSFIGGGLALFNPIDAINIAITNTDIKNNTIQLDHTFTSETSFQAILSGGGIYLLNMDITPTNIDYCNIEGNRILLLIFGNVSPVPANTGRGGGVYINNLDLIPPISNCVIQRSYIGNNNIYVSLQSQGGGIYQISNLLINCTIDSNKINIFNTSSNGFGVYSDHSEIVNCTITSNDPFNTITPINKYAVFIVFNNFERIINNIIGLNNAVLDINTLTASIFTGNFIGSIPSPNLGPIGGLPTKHRVPNFGSPVIDSGNTFIYSSLYPLFNTDQRGQPRIVNGIIDIGSIETGIICYTGDTKVYIKNIETGEEKYIKVSEINKNKHLVYNMTANTFIPIKTCIITSKTSRIYRIPKDFFGIDKPNEDLYISGGHKILLDGKCIKVKNIPNIKRVKIKKQSLYSICTENQEIININNIPVFTWGYGEWLTKKDSLPYSEL